MSSDFTIGAMRLALSLQKVKKQQMRDSENDIGNRESLAISQYPKYYKTMRAMMSRLPNARPL
tara:strand:- start:524 stop:712 length:189 start_codon:yes stop_codon:yes gene_type:complete